MYYDIVCEMDGMNFKSIRINWRYWRWSEQHELKLVFNQHSHIGIDEDFNGFDLCWNIHIVASSVHSEMLFIDAL